MAGKHLEEKFKSERLRMVEEQIADRGVRDPKTLEAMRTVRRHLFVNPSHIYSAYEDRPLPIGEGQTISQPYIVALMTEALKLRGARTFWKSEPAAVMRLRFCRKSAQRWSRSNGSKSSLRCRAKT